VHIAIHQHPSTSEHPTDWCRSSKRRCETISHREFGSSLLQRHVIRLLFRHCLSAPVRLQLGRPHREFSRFWPAEGNWHRLSIKSNFDCAVGRQPEHAFADESSPQVCEVASLCRENFNPLPSEEDLFLRQ